MQDAPTPQIPRVALSHGDLNGIGYEIILKTFADARMFDSLTPILYGQSKAFSYYKKNFGMDAPNYSLTRDARQAFEKKLNIINVVENELKIEPGAPTSLSTEMSVVSVKRAFEDLRNGLSDAFVMAPDSPIVTKSNYDYLLSFYKDTDPMRVLVSDKMRIGLATDDMPLGQALSQIDIRFLVSKLSTFSQALRSDFGVDAPKIAVMGVNPHAGTEAIGEDEKVLKAINDAQHKDIFAFGPFTSTQLFAEGLWRKYDGILALYYEQGMFPLKMMALGGCACYWAGLPVVCAAPLHGPMFELANLNKAQPDSFRAAVFLAHDVVISRRAE